jgi:prepilin-type N-terminal cleavage/methylation domain-containing protein
VARRDDRPDEGGFTLVEVLVALGLITVMMASLGSYFVSSIKTSRYQAQIQSATRIAQSAMESARGIGGPTLLVGRAPCGSGCFTLPTGYAALIGDTVRYDAPVSGTAPSVPLPSTAELVTVSGVKYYRYFLVGKCWQAAAGGICTTTTTLPVAMVRLTIGVTWTAPECLGSFCVRVASALFSADPSDPLFTTP